jgi:DNA ligase (NAD+)
MLASEFLKKLKCIQDSDLDKVKGIGNILKSNFQTFLDSPRYQKLLNDFTHLEEQQIYLDIFSQKQTSENQSLAGQTICITGTFNQSRTHIKEKLESLGAQVANSISSKTTILLAGENAGSKLDKAKSLNVKIVKSLNELLN